MMMYFLCKSSDEKQRWERTTQNGCSQPRKEPCFCSYRWIGEQINSLHPHILYTYMSEPFTTTCIWFALFFFTVLEDTFCLFYLLVHV